MQLSFVMHFAYYCIHSLLQCFVQIIMRWDYFEVCNCDQSGIIGNEVTRERNETMNLNNNASDNFYFYFKEKNLNFR